MKNKFSPGLVSIKKEHEQRNNAEKEVIHWLSDQLGKVLLPLFKAWSKKESIEEIRLRVGQPLLLRTAYNEYFVTPAGQIGFKDNSYLVTREDLQSTLEKMTYSSLYAAEEELRQGFLTLPGGHRVGLSGETVVEDGKIRIMRNISAINIRLARQPQCEVLGLLKLLLDKNKNFLSTLLISPPRAGKTTILRLLVKQLSEGVPALGLVGQTVGVVDERSEIAGMWQGIPRFDLGCRTDVLDRCPKVLGINMLIRSMAPSVIAVDELGGAEDVSALKEAARCGVKVLATAHAGSLEELSQRRQFKELLLSQTFDRAVLLSRAQGPGTVEGVYDLLTGKEIGKEIYSLSRVSREFKV
ncbi:MAG TPA: stage III sporulation protein AA [Peptococcaceae bacterium]|nr:stage III sporulation protein AA [Peptococcaceae bacterium]